MRRVLVVLVLVVATAPVAGAGHTGCPSTDPRVDTWEFDSDAIGSTIVCVLLPDDYYKGDARDYPVLFLLHGVGDYEGQWLEKTDIETVTENLDVIVVMPDGGGHNGDAGWYSNWVDGPAWESFHIGELVPAVDGRYRTTGVRAVAGNSMGGFGAMSYAARYPDVFVAAASFSGAVDIAFGGPAQAAAFEMGGQHGLGTPGDDVWGPYEDDEVNWRDHNPPDLSPNLGATDIWLSTGNGVTMPGDSPASAPIESGVYTLNQSFHTDLTTEGKDHTWHDRGHGTHEWRYWEADLAAYLTPLDDLPADPPAPPVSFALRSARPAFGAWGWSFDTEEGRAKEFLDLRDVSEDGFVMTGSGTVHVRTAPVYDAGATYRVVQVTDRSVSSTLHLVDVDGRLRLTVDLGPAHTAQQYTPEGRMAEFADRDYWHTVVVTIAAA